MNSFFKILSRIIRRFGDKIFPVTNKFEVGDTVYIARSRVGLDVNSPSALYKSKIIEIANRSAKINIGNDISNYIPTSALIEQLGILVLRIGDFESEGWLLDPLRESLRHYFSLLLSDGEVLFWDVRSVGELRRYWVKNSRHKAITHIILVGHGKKDSIRFGDTWKTPNEISEALNVEEVSAKQFISLCCETGIAEFGKTFSELPICESLIAPFQSIHGSVASQFCQTYFSYLLLHGKTPGVAFNNAKVVTPEVSFRRWKNGKMGK